MLELLAWIIVIGVIAATLGFMAGRRRGEPGPAVSAPEVAAPAPAGRPGAVVQPAVAANPHSALATAKSWGYQLQGLRIAEAAASPFDLLVVDYSRDGTEATALKAAEVTRLKAKPDGGRRLVVAYLSVGEAESYRFYWRPEWKNRHPAWLLGENPEWEGNYAVAFWDPGWQQLMLGGPEAYIDRIIAQGFDGLYLDKCDVTDDLETHFKAVARTRPDLQADMAAFVARIGAYVREKRPGFLVIMQNAEPLLERSGVRKSIDAVAKEELLYGLDRAEKPNTKAEIEESRSGLELMRRDGKPVFVVEYLNAPEKIAEATATARRLGYVLYVAPKDRELARLVPPTAVA